MRPTGGQRAMEGARRLGPGLAGTNSGPPGPIRVKSRPWPGLVGSGWREEAFQDGMGLGSRLLPLRPLLMEIPRSPIRRRFKTGGSRASARQRPLARGASLTPPAGVGPSGRRRCVAAQGVCPTRRRGGVATDRRAAGEVLTMGTGDRPGPIQARSGSRPRPALVALGCREQPGAQALEKRSSRFKTGGRVGGSVDSGCRLSGASLARAGGGKRFKTGWAWDGHTLPLRPRLMAMPCSPVRPGKRAEPVRPWGWSSRAAVEPHG